MGKRPLNPNRTIDHMDVVVIKEQLESVTSEVNKLVALLGGSEIGPTKTKGVVALVNEVFDKVEDMISKFEHAEKWRVSFKAAQADNEQRAERRRQQAEEREYAATQEAARHKRELELKDADLAREKRTTRNRTILAVIMGITGFLAKEIFEKYFA